MDDPAAFAVEDTVDLNTQEILLHAANHDLKALKPFLRVPGNASVQDPETGYTPLHAAIAACGEYDASKVKSASSKTTQTNGSTKGEEEDEEVDIEAAKAVVQELFLSGAIWNDLDKNDETPGCLAWRLGWKELYELCVEAGVRAEVLLGLLGSYEELESGDEDEDEEMEEATEAVGNAEQKDTTEAIGQEGNVLDKDEDNNSKRDVNSEDYLSSTLHITNNNLLDSDNNGVMMTWETDIMQRTVDLLKPSTSSSSSLDGPRVLNIGFGLGIIDTIFQNFTPPPQTHHIIEAHPDVLSTLSSPSHAFGPSWSSSTTHANQILPGRWQDIIPQIIEQGQKYDIIYFDTFGEDYSQLKLFFQEYVPELMDEGGCFGFFNGLGADRRVCYDVYTRVVERDLEEVGSELDECEGGRGG
jgi:protein arginine N-methyltransferase 2